MLMMKGMEHNSQILPTHCARWPNQIRYVLYQVRWESVKVALPLCTSARASTLIQADSGWEPSSTAGKADTAPFAHSNLHTIGSAVIRIIARYWW